MSGLVKKINVTNGQTVAAGTVLAELDDTELQQAVKKAQNAYDKAKANYNDSINQRERYFHWHIYNNYGCRNWEGQ